MILFLLNILTFLAISLLAFVKEDVKKVKTFALAFAFAIFIASLLLLFKIDPKLPYFQELITGNNIPFFFHFSFGLDSCSIIFIILSTLLIVICVLASFTVKYRLKLKFIMLFIIELFLINVFSVTSLFYFYFFFEGLLIPMFLLIGIWGSRREKVSAAYQFFLYTLIGSFLFFISILLIKIICGTTDYLVIRSFSFPFNLESFFFISFFLSFAVKVPMFPFHIWLPKAHTEASTAGSVLLAGILLKLGTYGMYRFNLFLFPDASRYYTPAIFTLALIAIVLSSLATLRQIDTKRIIAYASVGHMNYTILGLFAGNVVGVVGSLFLMIAHAIVSSGLFLCVGFLYDRYKTRNFLYYRQLAVIMPILAIIFFLLILGNMGFPGTSNFVPEFLILVSLLEKNYIVMLLSSFGLLFSAFYSFWFYTRIFFGNFLLENRINYFCDLSKREFYTLSPLVILMFILGIKPNLLNFFFEVSTYTLFY